MICVDCGDEKELEAFAVSKKRADGTVTRRKACKPCYSTRVRAWQAANPEKVAERNRSYYAEHQDQERERVRAYGHTRDYRPKNATATCGKPANWTTALVVETYGTDCHLCGQPIDMDLVWPDPDSFTIDHVVPMSQDGSNDLENVRPSHGHCNFAKRDGRRILQEVG